MDRPPPTRRPDIDGLRVLATYALFLFHTAMVFSPFPFYHVTNGERSEALGIFAGFIAQWHMPLFFLLAGWSVVASLSARGRRAFTKERIYKLWIPLVMGCLILAPPIKYVELLGGQNLNFRGLGKAEGFDKSFIEFLPSFFTSLEYFTWSHLWFLAYLLTFSLLYRPLFSWIMERVDHVSLESAAWAYLPIVPLALIQVTLRQRWPGIQNLIDDWANFAYYSLYFIVGFLLAGFPAVEHIVHREWKRSAAIGTVAMGLLWLCAVKLPHHPTVILGLTAVAGWCTVVAFLGLARRYVTTRSRTLSYLAASAFPVYLLHQSAITLLGHQMVQLPWGIAAKFVALLLISLATTLFVYHFGIRPLPALGFFFGIKPNDARRRSTPPIERWKIQPGRTTL